MTKATKSRFLLMMTLTATLVVALIGTAVCGVAAAASSPSVVVQTTPALPLFDVVFLATTSAGTDKTLFVSSTSDCSTRLTPICTLGRSQTGLNYNDTTCVFNITGSSLSIDATTTTAIPSLYWCSSAAGSVSFETLQMNKVVATPSYAYLNKDTTLTLNAATPVGSTVGFYTTSTCTTMLDGATATTVTSSRKLSVNVGTRGITYLCASFPTVLGDTSVLSARTVIYGTNAYDIYTTQGIRHRAVTISADATFLYLSLSTDPQCATLAQDYQQTSSGNAVLTVNVPRGTYYFCAVMSAGVNGIGVFVPALSKFEVLEYGVQPQTMYTNYATTMSFAMDAVAVESMLQAALFSTSACSTSTGVQLTSWSSTMTWTVTTAGTYYACVRTGSSTTELGYVNQVVVSTIPAVTLSRTPGIMGLGEVATVTRNSSSSDVATPAILTVGISSSASCNALLESGNTTTTGTTASFYISENSPSTVYLCISNRLTTDRSNGESSEATTAVFYSLGSLTLSTYSLSYPALRTHTPLTIGLDSNVEFNSSTYMYLAPALISNADGSTYSSAATATTTTTITDDDDATCTAAIAASADTMAFLLSTSDFTLTAVSFPTAGKWLLCVKEVNVLDNAPVRLRTLTVYGDAIVTPRGILPGIPASLGVTAIPSSTTVSLTDSTTCSASMNVIATTTSSLTGAATLAVTYSTQGTLILCVGYRGELNSRDTDAVLMKASEVPSTTVRAVPPVAVAATKTRLTFAAPGAPTLNGYAALLVPTRMTTTCPIAATSGVAQLTISGNAVVGTMSGNEVASATFTPDTGVVGTTYLVCVGMTGRFLSAGTVSVVAVPNLAPDPQPMAYGLPAQVTFPAAYMSALTGDAFVVIRASASCTDNLMTATLLASGRLNSVSGSTASFLLPSVDVGVAAVRFCVAQKSKLVNTTLGYADAGTATLAQFTAVTQYVQRQRTNTLVGSPEVGGGSLYLVRCDGVACSAVTADMACGSTSTTRYTTSSTANLTAPVGTYLLCQSVNATSAIVGSNTTVQVIDPYVMTITADTSALRAYVPFTVTVTGGPSATNGAYTIVVQSTTVDCRATAAEAQRFTISGGRGRIMITDVTPGQDVHFCVQPSSVDGFEVLTAHLLHYMTPAAVIAGVATTLTSAAAPVSGAYAKLASTAACTDEVTGGEAVALVNSQAAFKVNGCSSTTRTLGSVYYCETSGGGVYESRGAVGILRPSNCSEGQRESIEMVYAAPGAAISSYGLASSLLTEPRLSWTGDCTSLVDSRVGTVGYAPGVNETATFFVCARVVGAAASLTFTTEKPTLRVLNWAASPSAALSRYNLTMGTQPSVRVQLNYPAPSPDTFFSAAKGCTASLASAAALATPGAAATYRTVGVSGLVYVCTTNPLTAAPVAVARFLSVTPPAVVKATPAVVRGAAYTVQLAVEGSSPLYSMQPGVDATFAYHEYYTSNNRSVFLSTDECGSALGGVVAAVDTQGRVTFTTNAISTALEQLALCAGTPAGVGTVLARVTVTAGNVYPTVLVSGVRGAPIFIPLYPRTAFALSASSSDCSATSGMPTFTTDGEGYGAASLVDGSGSALASGQYMLCYDAAVAGASGGGGRGDGSSAPAAARAAMTALDVVELRAASHFAVRGTTFVVGVAGTAELLQDLVSSYLVPGLSTTRNCTTMTTEYGTWSAKSDTAVVVNATATAGSGLYLCAVAPLNNSLVALPGATGVRFATSSIVLPSGEWDACHEYAIAQCVPPGSSAAPTSADVLAVVHGECCSSARVVVGQSSMSSGTCRLRMDYKAMQSYGSNATFSVCVLNRDDDAVCTTLATGVAVTTSCTPAAAAGNGLGGGVVAGIVVGCVVGGLLLIALVIFLVWLCRRRATAGNDAKNRKLVAFQEFAEDDHHLIGYLVGGRHPLLYYPAGSHVGRSVSPSPPYPSTGSGGCSALEEVEEEERDDVALQEARARYNLRLHFSEALQQVEVEAKNAAVDAGLDATWTSGDWHLRGVAQPVRRCIESIVTEDGEGEELALMSPPAASASAAQHQAAVDASDVIAQTVPEERDVNLSADGNVLVAADAVPGHHRKVRSHSIESASRPPLSPSESYFTNDDCEEREEDASCDLDVAYVDHAATRCAAPQGGGTGNKEGGDDDDDVPRRRVVVRHFSNVSSVRSRRRRLSVSPPRSRSSQHRDDSRGQPHLDPTQVDRVVPQMTTMKTTEESVFAAGELPARAVTPNQAASGALKADTSVDVSAVLARSPITSPDAHDLSEGALTVGGIDGVPGQAAAAPPQRHNSDTAEKEEDLLSFTVTQRFHDEKRFVLEQEDCRRQRLCNWEEEEWAQLGQEELRAYTALSMLYVGGGEAGAGTSMPATASEDPQTDASATRGDAANVESVGEERREEEEHVYRAPSAPTMLPSLPPAPRPKTLQNDQFYVVSLNSK